MAEISRHDEEVLRLLTKEGLISRSQELRLRAGLKRGMSLGEAANKTPLVEAVKLASVQSLAAQNLKDNLPQEPISSGKMKVDLDESETETSVRPASDFEELRGFKIKDLGPVDSKADTARDLDVDLDDGVPTYELEYDTAGSIDDEDEMDLPESEDDSLDEELDDLSDLDVDLTSASGDIEDEIETIRIRPSKEGATPSNAEFESQVGTALEEAFEKKEDHASRSSSEIQKPVDAHLEQLTEKETFDPSAPVQTFDFGDSEGITLIEEVNGLLARAVEDNGRGFILDKRSEGENFTSFGTDGKPARSETVGDAMVEKVTNRLKVMARLEPWRAQSAQRGKFHFAHGAIKGTAYVHAEPVEEGGELLTVHLERT